MWANVHSASWLVLSRAVVTVGLGPDLSHVTTHVHRTHHAESLTGFFGKEGWPILYNYNRQFLQVSVLFLCGMIHTGSGSSMVDNWYWSPLLFMQTFPFKKFRKIQVLTLPPRPILDLEDGISYGLRTKGNKYFAY